MMFLSRSVIPRAQYSRTHSRTCGATCIRSALATCSSFRRGTYRLGSISTSQSATAILVLAEEARALLAHEFSPDGFNIGVNVGEAAGQTVWHAHLHLMPRYSGDVPNPRGGVRAVNPWKQHY